MQAQYERLTDPHGVARRWEIIKEKLPIQRKRKYDLRDIVDAIFWILRTGSQWRNLPGEFPKWNIVYYYFRKWKKDGTQEGLNIHLNMLMREQEGRESTPSAVSIDTQPIKKAPFVSEDTGIDGPVNSKIKSSFSDINKDFT